MVGEREDVADVVNVESELLVVTESIEAVVEGADVEVVDCRASVADGLGVAVDEATGSSVLEVCTVELSLETAD